MGKPYILIIGEKPDITTQYAAALGGVLLENGKKLDGTTLTTCEGVIKKQRFKNGMLEGIAERGKLKGKRIIYTWAFGHIIRLCDAKDYDVKYKNWSLDNFPFVPSEFRRKLGDGFEQHFKRIKQLMNSSDCEYIINGGDADREGNLIQWEILDMTGTKKPVKRLWIHSTDPDDMIRGFDSLKDNSEYDNLTNSGIARSIADWLVGANLTTLTTLKYGIPGSKEILSIGRVITPTLNIVVSREKEILNFKPDTYFEVQGMFAKGKDTYKGIMQYGKDNRIKNEKEAREIVGVLNRNEKATIKSAVKEPYYEQPPEFFDLGAIQGEANTLYGFSIKKTLDIVDKLYLNGYASYPRTQCRTVPTAEAWRLEKVIQNLPKEYKDYKDRLIKKDSFNLSNRYVKTTADAHFAIIPLGKSDTSKLTEDEKKIYDLLIKSVIAPYLGQATWEKTKVITTVEGYDFLSQGKALIKEGFRDLIPPKKDDVILPSLSKGEAVDISSISPSKKSTKAPKRLTEGALKSAMENAKIIDDLIDGEEDMSEEKLNTLKSLKGRLNGIGTPATRADIIERLIACKYVVREDKYLKPSDKGMWLIDNFPIDEIKQAEMTAEWEYRLELINDGKESLEKFIEDIKKFTITQGNKLKSANYTDSMKKQREKQQTSEDDSSLGKCPLCGNAILENKNGTAYGCSNWKGGCKFTIWIKDSKGKDIEYGGKTLTKTLVKSLLKRQETGELTLKNKNGDEYKDRLYLILVDNKPIIKIGWQLKKMEKESKK